LNMALILWQFLNPKFNEASVNYQNSESYSNHKSLEKMTKEYDQTSRYKFHSEDWHYKSFSRKVSKKKS
jgi:hypothetical protein